MWMKLIKQRPSLLKQLQVLRITSQSSNPTSSRTLCEFICETDLSKPVKNCSKYLLLLSGISKFPLTSFHYVLMMALDYHMPIISRTSTNFFLFNMNYFFAFKNACGKAPCKNNATCQSGFTSKGYRCLCTPGFTGENCEYGKQEISATLTFSCVTIDSPN